MSRNDAWMPLYVGDYLADTGHLRALEHGAYLLLILHYWRKGPLPDDDEALAAIGRVDRREWQRIGATLRAFFNASDGRLTHKRIDEEKAKAAANSEKRKAAADSRWNAHRNQEQSTSNANASVLHDGCTSNGYDLHLHLNKEEDLERESPSLSHPVKRPKLRLVLPEEGDFAEFWEAYPRKEGKGGARKAYVAAVKKVAPDVVLNAVRSTRWNPNPKYIPHPATWLNQERWADEVDNRDPVLVAAAQAAALLPDDGWPGAQPLLIEGAPHGRK